MTDLIHTPEGAFLNTAYSHSYPECRRNWNRL